MMRVLGRQNPIARGILRVGQISDKAASLIGSVGLDGQMIGQVASRGLKGISTLAPKLAVVAERAGDIRQAGSELRTAFGKRDVVGGLKAGKRLAEIGEQAFKTKKGDLSLKERSGGMSTMPVPPASFAGGFGGGGDNFGF